MLAPMAALRWPSLLPLLALALAACEPGGAPDGGLRSFGEMDAGAAVRLLAGGGARLLQVREVDGHAARLAGASLVDAAGSLPRLPADSMPVLVVATRPQAARSLAARLVRDGVPRVAVVRGGIQAWLAASGGGPPSASREPPGARRDS
jgi:rhodanese-related sulfurtransferase